MSEHNRRNDDKPMIKVLKMWPIVLSIIALVVSFTVLKVTVEANTARIQKNLCTLEKNSEDHDMFRQRLIRLETISDMIPEMRADIKKILQENRR